MPFEVLPFVFFFECPVLNAFNVERGGVRVRRKRFSARAPVLLTYSHESGEEGATKALFGGKAERVLPRSEGVSAQYFLSCEIGFVSFFYLFSPTQRRLAQSKSSSSPSSCGCGWGCMLTHRLPMEKESNTTLQSNACFLSPLPRLSCVPLPPPSRSITQHRAGRSEREGETRGERRCIESHARTGPPPEYR